jgi:aminoglycoside phosphotransferase (APT) family kinase protein
MAPEALQDISGGNRQLLDLLKRYPDFGIALDRLASDWKFDCLIHGDIKWDNCVLTPSMNDTVKLKLVDWELADWGDASWDVAAIFSSFIVFWIQSLPMRPEGSIAQAISETRFPIERMQPAIRSFWNAYVAEMQLDRVAAREVLRRAVAMCGARTIQTAYEFGQAAPQLNQLTYFILQASLNILARPEEASSELLGLTIQ